MASKVKSPVWFRLIANPLYRLGIICVLVRDTPDVQWSILFYRLKSIPKSKKGKP